MERAYLIRYGLARTLGRFEATSETFEQGQSVVIRTHRGTELGEVVSEAPETLASIARPSPILRKAGFDDLERSRSFGQLRIEHYEACQAVFEGGAWPLDLIDAEPLLDDRRTVLHYLGPHRLDTSGLIAAFRDLCGLDVVLEPVGRDVPEPEPEPEPEPVEEEVHGCGSCGSQSDGGCGSSGSCGSGGGCAVKALVGARRRASSEV
jgi:cell fate regulator YaaT (PSP1 superfamily)